MLKAIFSYILIVLGVTALYLSTSKKQMSNISSTRNESTDWWGSQKDVSNGDLLRMSYLSLVPYLHSPSDYVFKDVSNNDTPNNINLYLNGDSYTYKIPATVWQGVNKYTYAWVYNQHIKYQLDTSKKNILILEHSERYVRHFLAGLDVLKLIYDSADGSRHHEYAHLLAENKKKEQHKLLTALFSKEEIDIPLFNKNINQNLEYNLFNYNLLNSIREVKAMMNYNIFKRASGAVVVSKNGDQLFLKETLEKTGKSSSYSYISNDEYNNIVTCVNIIYNHYKQKGFDEIYLAMIPNPVSVLAPERYNSLIPKLQTDTTVQIKFIDYYGANKNQWKKVYHKGDTHWNNYGIQQWIKQVNDTLKRWNTRR